MSHSLTSHELRKGVGAAKYQNMGKEKSEHCYREEKVSVKLMKNIGISAKKKNQKYPL